MLHELHEWLLQNLKNTFQLIIFTVKEIQLALPVPFPDSCAQLNILFNRASAFSDASQFSKGTVASTPAVLWLAFTPQNNAVAVLQESGTNLLAEYV